MWKQQSIALGTLFVFALISVAHAAPTSPSIAINFGTNQPDGLGNEETPVEGAAGVLGTELWNNLFDEFGGPEPLEIDLSGAANPSSAEVEWVSQNL